MVQLYRGIDKRVLLVRVPRRILVFSTKERVYYFFRSSSITVVPEEWGVLGEG
eukprot:SAG11_NODE_31730_length_289_cov_1.610526_1_plen_52_part_01